MIKSNSDPTFASIFVIYISNRSFFRGEQKASEESVLAIAMKNGEITFTSLFSPSIKLRNKRFFSSLLKYALHKRLISSFERAFVL